MDAEGRRLEREAAGGDEQAWARLLAHRVRSGQLHRDRLLLAAQLGDEAARLALGERGVDPVGSWGESLLELPWRDTLRGLVRHLNAPDAYSGDPFFLFEARPAEPEPPGDWLQDAALRDFYDICAGGHLAGLHLFSPTELLARQDELQRLLNGLGAFPALIVFGEGADAMPLVLDSSTGAVRTYYWRDAWDDPADGWTDPSFASTEAMFDELFDLGRVEAAGEAEASWKRALALVAPLPEAPRKRAKRPRRRP
jgi:hypothetical protein